LLQQRQIVGESVFAFNDRTNGAAEPVGRAHEQQVLSAAFDLTCAGNLQLVLISGEAGIGKTTLVEHFLNRMRTRATLILSGACYDVSSSPPYSLWRNVLDQLLDSSSWSEDSFLTSFADQNELFQDVRDRLEGAAAKGPVIVVLEDAHWADQESLDLLRSIGQRIRDVPLMIIVTYREDEITAGQPFYEVLLPLVRECGATRIDLRRLRHEDIRSLVHNRYTLEPADVERLINTLFRRTGGNPLFLIELLRSMEMTNLLRREDGRWHVAGEIETEIPLIVRQLIERRLRNLEPGARVVLQTAAIIGFDVRPEVLLPVTGMSEEEVSCSLQQAIDAFLLEQSPGKDQLRFRHALVQEALYSTSPILWRQSQHRKIGMILAETPGADASMVAEHFRLGRDARAGSWALKSARQARRLYAPHAVITHLNPILANAYTLSIEERIEAFRLRGWAYHITGSFHEADNDFRTELRWALESGNRHATRDALVRLAELWTYRDYQRVGEFVEQALQVTEDINDQSLLAHTHNRFGTWCLSQDDPERALDHHRRALAISEQTADQRGIAESLDLIGLALSLSGDLIRAADEFQQAKSHFQVLSDQRGLSDCLANTAHLGPTFLTDTAVPASTLDECIRAGQQGLKLASAIDYRSGLVYSRVRLVACLGAKGEYQQALDMVHQSIVDAERAGNQQLLSAAHSMAGLLWLDLMRPDLARDHADQARTIAERIGSTFRIRMGAAILALSYVAHTELDAAEAELLRTDTDQESARTLAQYLLWRARIELELARGNSQGALHWIDVLLDSIPQANRDRPALRISFLRGQALNQLQRFEEAESWLVSARKIAREYDACGLLWRIQRELGLSYLGFFHDRSNARAAFSDARQIVEELSTSLSTPGVRSHFLASASAQIPDPAGPTPLQAAKQVSGGLTRRQRQVAKLVAAGSSNRVIAEKLSISERTVESHVSAILTTLGFESRAQIVAWCLEHDMSEDTSYV
jgi:DNA-binding CsgD family transcriptional regulator